MNNIVKPSRRFALLFKALLYLYPAWIFIFWMSLSLDGNIWMSIGFSPGYLTDFLSEGQVMEPELWQRILCFVSALLPGCAVMYIYSALARLFTLYSKGAIFEQENVSCYRAVGWGLIWQQILIIPYRTLTILIMTLTNPEGQKILSVTIDGMDIYLAIVGVMILLVSRIMDEGRKIHEEQALTV